MPDPKLEVILAARDMTKKAFTSFGSQIKLARQSVFSFKGALASFGVGLGVKELAGSFLDVAGSFEQMELKLDAITKGKGPETLERLNQWALDMPVNTRKTVDTFAMMAAMGLDPTIKKMETLVDVSVIFGEDAMPRVARALGQMQTLGKLSAEELNQLSEAGINARKYLSEAFGMGVEDLKKSNVQIEQIIAAITDGLERDFGGAARNAMNNWQGLKATTVSYLEEVQRRIMDAGLFDEIKKQLAGVNTELQDWLVNNDELIKQKVPEYLEATKDKLAGVYGTAKAMKAMADAMPGDTMTWGFVGWFLLRGKTRAAGLVAALALVNEGMKPLGADVATMKKDAGELAEALGNIADVFSGRRDWNTGAQKLTLPMPDRPGGKFTGQIPPRPEDEGPGSGSPGAASLWPDNALPIQEMYAAYKQIVADNLLELEELHAQYGSNIITMEGGLYTTRNDYLQQNLKYQQIVNDAYFRNEKDLAKKRILNEKQVAMQKKAIQQWSLGVTSSFLNSLYVLTGRSNEGLFQMHKYAAIAEGTIKAYLAAANTLGTAPWPINYGAAAIALAQGLAIVAGMQSVSIGGGGGGASIGGGGMPAYTTPTIPELDTGEEEKGRLTIIIQGDFIGDEAYVDGLVEKINQAQEERNVTLIASESRYASEVV